MNLTFLALGLVWLAIGWWKADAWLRIDDTEAVRELRIVALQAPQILAASVLAAFAFIAPMAWIYGAIAYLCGHDAEGN
jgi:hypothetical protein